MSPLVHHGHLAPVLRGVGLVLHVPALMALVSLAVCVICAELEAVPGFVMTACVAGGLGQVLFWLGFRGMEIRQHHAMLIAAVAWLLVSVVGALPFWVFAHHLCDEGGRVFLAPENALFESLSGFTATGLTMVERASELPRSLQWWRSFSEWVGGVGVIMLMLSVLPPSRDALHLYYSEGREQRILPSIKSTTQAIWSVYVLYTLVGIGLLWLAGEPFWRALNHGMTAIATGGFTITDDSLAKTPAGVKLAYLPLMVMGAISFLLHYRLIWHRGRDFGDGELRLLLATLVFGSGLLAVENVWGVPGSGAFESVFQWVSALTTTGFQSVSLQHWSVSALVMLTLASTAGAMAGSTCGGIKQMRVLYLFKGIGWRLQAILGRPHQVMRYRLDHTTLSRSEAEHRVQAASVLTATWLTSMLIAVLILVHVVPEGTRLEQVIFEVASAQGNVGLSAGITGASLPLVGKLVLMAVMWVGRLEIVPVLVLVVQLFVRR
jgi:trk system potassium uptake protein TrkH